MLKSKCISPPKRGGRERRIAFPSVLCIVLMVVPQAENERGLVNERGIGETRPDCVNTTFERAERCA